MINISCGMNTNEIISACNSIIAEPSLIFFGIAVFIFYGLAGLITYTKEKTNWGKFVLSWVVFTILTVLFLVFLIKSPFIVDKLASIFIK